MSAKELELRPIRAAAANRIVKRLHYSGKVVRNSQLHIGVYYHGGLHGAMQIGPPLDRSKLLPLVEGTSRENMAELNRLAFDDTLPRNSESRAIAVLARLLRGERPELKWLVSFADATTCGDGTIYRASGMVLTSIRYNNNIVEMPDGRRVHKMTLESSPTRPIEWLGGRSYYDITGGRYSLTRFCESTGATSVVGHQLRYILFIDPTWRQRLTVPEIPYEEIARRGASMYRGMRAGSIESDAPADPGGQRAVQLRPRRSNLMG